MQVNVRPVAKPVILAVVALAATVTFGVAEYVPDKDLQKTPIEVAPLAAGKVAVAVVVPVEVAEVIPAYGKADTCTLLVSNIPPLDTALTTYVLTPLETPLRVYVVALLAKVVMVVFVTPSDATCDTR